MQAGDDPADDGEVVSAADFSGLEELFDKGDVTEEEAIQWLEDNVPAYNINVQAGAAYEAALAEEGDPDLAPAEREAILASPEFKEAADWWLGPGPEQAPPIPNMAGIGRSGWDIMGVDEENCQPLLALDLTGGQVPNNEQNALLSDEAKRFMAILAREFPDMCTPAFLAQLFRVRQQRVMAILALKKLEFEAEEQYKADMAAEEAAALEQAAERQRQQQEADQFAAEAATAQVAGDPAADGADAGAAAASPAADGAAADDGEVEDNAHSAAGGNEAVVDSTAAAAGAASPPAEAAASAEGSAASNAANNGDPAGDAGADGQQPKRGRGAHLTDFQTEADLDEFTKDMHELDVLSEVQDIVEHDIWECVHAEGTDERHIKLLPSIPRFKEGEDGQLVHDGLTAEQLQMLAEMEAREEDAHAVEEFSRRLAYNMGQLAPGVQRQSRVTAAPQRPKQGWTLVVQPLSRRKGKDVAPAYAAEPSGRARRLTESEAVTLQRARPLPRRRQA